MTVTAAGLDTLHESLLARTARFVDVPSVSFAERPMVEHLEALLGSAPHLELHRIGDNLVARTFLGRARRLILAGHTDTVPVNDNGTARRDGDVVWGVEDRKSTRLNSSHT